LGRDTLVTILGDRFEEVVYKNYIKWVLEKNYLLSKLNKGQISKVIDSMKILAYKANELVFRKGISGFQKVVVIIEGTLKKLKSGTVVASRGHCWG
jgi:cGMP-dependent protein kinase